MATTIRTEKYQRGVFGTLIKWIFIAYNVLMLIWLIGGIASVSSIQANSDAERAGAAIGATIGVSMILTLWFFGAVILGLFTLLTRGNKVIVEESR